MKSIYQQYQKEIIPELKKRFGYSNYMACPRVEKVTINVGLGRALQDKSLLDVAKKSLEKITGQKPVVTRAKNSIAGFKIRKGQIVGMKVTLRGKRMYHFLEKLLKITFARVQDFRGISKKTVDTHGNLSVGIREHVVFPEIESEDIEHIHGLEISVTTTAKNQLEGLTLFQLLGFPFKEE